MVTLTFTYKSTKIGVKPHKKPCSQGFVQWMEFKVIRLTPDYLLQQVASCRWCR